MLGKASQMQYNNMNSCSKSCQIFDTRRNPLIFSQFLRFLTTTSLEDVLNGSSVFSFLPTFKRDGPKIIIGLNGHFSRLDIKCSQYLTKILTMLILAMRSVDLGTAELRTWYVKRRSWLFREKLWTIPPVRSWRALVVKPWWRAS